MDAKNKPAKSSYNNNRANQMNPNHIPSGPGKEVSRFYQIY